MVPTSLVHGSNMPIGWSWRSMRAGSQSAIALAARAPHDLSDCDTKGTTRSVAGPDANRTRKVLTQMKKDARRIPSAADRPQPNQSKDRAGVSGRRYRAGSANSKGNRKQRKKRKSRACMARAPDLRRCRCNLRLRFLRAVPFPCFDAIPTRHDPCGKRFRRNSALPAVHRKITAGCGDLPG